MRAADRFYGEAVRETAAVVAAVRAAGAVACVRMSSSDAAAVRALALSFPEAREDHPFGPESHVFKVGGGSRCSRSCTTARPSR